MAFFYTDASSAKNVSISKITSTDIIPKKFRGCFGVEGDGSGTLPYRLRQARYYELGSDIARWAWEHFSTQRRPLDLLDVGSYNGVLRQYTEIHPGSEYIKYHALDVYPHGVEFVYKSDDWIHYNNNLNFPIANIESNSFDVVVGEQVLEHLENYKLALSEMLRILRPNGILVLGVPIFLDGLHLVRRHVVPITDVVFRVQKHRGHIQAWSKRAFMRDLRSTCPELRVEAARGFRIMSGGILKSLEYCRWWWRFNRWIGSWVPSLCIELQIIARKIA